LPSAPSRFEVEHLHRLMLKASIEAAQLDEAVDQLRKDDSLWPALHHWSDAAESLEEAVERARPELQQDGTPREQIDRIRERLGGVEQRSKRFDLDLDLDFCVDAWTSLGHELAQLSGRRRDPLVRLLELRKPAIDQTTAMLSEAQRHEGLLQDQHRKVLELQKERDRASEKYERLRQAWLTAQRDCEAAEQQKAAAAPPQQYEVKKPPLPDLRRLTDGRPVIVRLPASTRVARILPSKPIPPLPPGKPEL
jgi:predicted  nucleic acid-binding Zn-ribbon protein